jgi:hypothetical protein
MTSRTSAKSRLNLFSKHLDSKPFLELNTPFSTERSGSVEDAQGNRIPRNKPQVLKKPEQLPKKEEPPKMASAQAPHPALMIPGPIEFDDEVLKSMSFYRYYTYPIVIWNMLIQAQRIPCWPAVRELLQRSPPEPAQALPDHRSCIATLRHLWLRHTWVGPGRRQLG